MSAQVFITRDELSAACVAEMFRPAQKRLATFREYRLRYGMPHGDDAGWNTFGWPRWRIPPG